MADRRTLPRWARWTAAGCGAAVIAAGTYLVADAVPSGAATTGLRTATVATGSVTQSIALSGSVERVDQVTAAFRTAGTVTSVKVEVGDEVEAGDVLATIGTADLERAVTVAQADLVAAQAALDADGSSSTHVGVLVVLVDVVRWRLGVDVHRLDRGLRLGLRLDAVPVGVGRPHAPGRHLAACTGPSTTSTPWCRRP